jgi:transcriptional regulator with XRE-family HTH domain
MTQSFDFSAIDRHIGLQLRSRRKEMGLKQRDIAAMLGLTFQQVQKYESGASRISASKLHLLAQKLQVPMQFFFDGLDPALEGQTAPASESFGSVDEYHALRSAFGKIEAPSARRSVINLVRSLAG